MRFDYITIAVTREFCAEPIAGLAGMAMANIVRQNKKVTRRIQGLAGIKKLAREFRTQEIAAVSGGPVQDQHRIFN